MHVPCIEHNAARALHSVIGVVWSFVCCVQELSQHCTCHQINARVHSKWRHSQNGLRQRAGQWALLETAPTDLQPRPLFVEMGSQSKMARGRAHQGGRGAPAGQKQRGLPAGQKERGAPAIQERGAPLRVRDTWAPCGSGERGAPAGQRHVGALRVSEGDASITITRLRLSTATRGASISFTDGDPEPRSEEMGQGGLCRMRRIADPGADSEESSCSQFNECVSTHSRK